MRGFDRPAINEDVSFGQEALDGAARELREPAAQKDIQPFPRQGRIHYKSGEDVGGLHLSL
jgi:hypothetical protein